mgnify:FL=1
MSGPATRKQSSNNPESKLNSARKWSQHNDNSQVAFITSVANNRSESDDEEEYSHENPEEEHFEPPKLKESEKMQQIASSFYKSDPYFGHEPLSFKEPEDGWKSISKAILTDFAPKNKLYDFEKFLPQRTRAHHNDHKHSKHHHQKPKVVKAVNFLDPTNIPSAIKHINESEIIQGDEQPFRKLEDAEQYKLRKIEELRSGLGQRRRDVLLAAINQPFHTYKFRKVMNQVNQAAHSPETLRNIEQLKDYNHVIKVQKRIIAKTMKPKIEQFREQVTLVDGQHKRNVIDIDKEVLILENEEENPHHQVKFTAQAARDNLNDSHERHIKSEASIEFSGMLDNVSDLFEFLESPAAGKQHHRRNSRDASIVFGLSNSHSKPREKMASTLANIDFEGKKAIKPPRHRRKSDVSHYSGGECKKLAAISHIVLPTDIKSFTIMAQITEKEEPTSEKSLSQPTRSRGQTIKKERAMKTMIHTVENRSRADSHHQHVDDEIYEEASPTMKMQLQAEQTMRSSSLKRQNIAKNKSADFRVLLSQSQAKNKIREFAPLSREIIGPTRDTEASQVLPTNEDAHTPTTRVQTENYFFRNYLQKSDKRTNTEGDEPETTMKRSTSQPRLRNQTNISHDAEYERKKRLKLGLDAVLRISGKAKSTVYKEISPFTEKQKLPTLGKTSSGAGLASGKLESSNKKKVSKQPRSASVDVRRKDSFETFEMKRQALPQPYLMRMSYCRPTNDVNPDVEAFEIGIGPKTGPLKNDFKYDKRSQSAVKIRRTGSNFYIRS